MPTGVVGGMYLKGIQISEIVEVGTKAYFAALSFGVFSSNPPLGRRVAVVSRWIASNPWPTSVRQY